MSKIDVASILEYLNDEQKNAVLHRDGPGVVFAAAGSGKTRVITCRIAYLMSQGVRGNSILALTFTNKAAHEMRDRVFKWELPKPSPLVATFHSFCARVLREFCEEIGFENNFSIYDESESKSILKKVIGQLNIKLDQVTTLYDYKQAIHRCKIRGLTPGDLTPILKDQPDFLPDFGKDVYKLYQESLAASNAMDFGDLLMNVLVLLRNNEMVLNKLRNRYRYILVDEYQDTNPAQFELISHLVSKSKNIFVVGDDDQSIYSWRGAIPSNIINFDVLYPDARKYLLEENYRSTQTIINAAYAVVKNNRVRTDKKIFTRNSAGEKIDIISEYDNESESWKVCETLEDEQAQYPYENCAIFYRTNVQSRLLEECLLQKQIPYKIFGSLRFYDRAEVKDLVSYLKLVVNQNDDVALMRVINLPPRGIGAKTVEAISQLATANGESMYAAIKRAIDDKLFKSTAKLQVFLNLMQEINETAEKTSLPALAEAILEKISYYDYINKKFPEKASDKIENIEELISGLESFVENHMNATADNWLQSIALDSEKASEANGVTLMTLHMAKGLEFDRVHIVGVEEGLIPHKNSMEDPGSFEEERRLFYVGITRAKKKLSLYLCGRRKQYNSWMSNQPSQFLEEIPKQYYSVKNIDSSENYGYTNATSNEMSYDYGDPTSHNSDYNADFSSGKNGGAASMDITPGSFVEHYTYGKGVVEQVIDNITTTKVVVNFSEFGRRRISKHHLRQLT